MEKTKEGALSAKGFTLDLLQDLAKGFLKNRLKSGLASHSNAISTIAVIHTFDVGTHEYHALKQD